jgi:hypothetical protein
MRIDGRNKTNCHNNKIKNVPGIGKELKGLFPIAKILRRISTVKQ